MIKPFILAAALTLAAPYTKALSSLEGQDDMVTFVQLSPVGAYYGNPIVRALANHPDYKGVNAIYVKGIHELTDTGIDSRLKEIARKIIARKPKMIVAETQLALKIEKYLPDELDSVIKTYSLSDNYDHYMQSYTAQLKSFFDESNYNFNKIYILHDGSPRSLAKAGWSEKHLAKAGFSKTSIVRKRLNSFQDIRLFIASMNSSPQSVLINNIVFLRDAELGQARYGDAIKSELFRFNKRHLDVGFWKAKHNEAIVFTPNVDELLRSFMTGGNPPAKPEMLINTEKFKLLKLKHLYINGIKQIDGIIE